MTPNALFLVLLSGAIGACVMGALVQWSSRGKATDTDGVQALGNFGLLGLGHGKLTGWIVHIVAGMVFAVPYAIVMQWLGLTQIHHMLLAGVATGALHGYVVGFWIIILLGEHHRFRRVREEGPVLAVIYMISHVVFGGVVGLMLGVTGAVPVA